MKRITAIVLSVFMMLSLVACSGSTDNAAESHSQISDSQTEHVSAENEVSNGTADEPRVDVSVRRFPPL